MLNTPNRNEYLNLTGKQTPLFWTPTYSNKPLNLSTTNTVHSPLGFHFKQTNIKTAEETLNSPETALEGMQDHTQHLAAICSHNGELFCQSNRPTSLACIWHYLCRVLEDQTGTSAMCWVSEEGHLSEHAEDPDWCHTQRKVPAVPLAATVCITVTPVSRDGERLRRYSHQ